MRRGESGIACGMSRRLINAMLATLVTSVCSRHSKIDVQESRRRRIANTHDEVQIEMGVLATRNQATSMRRQ